MAIIDRMRKTLKNRIVLLCWFLRIVTQHEKPLGSKRVFRSGLRTFLIEGRKPSSYIILVIEKFQELNFSVRGEGSNARSPFCYFTILLFS